MSRKFALIRSKVRHFDMLDFRREFKVAIGYGYTIRAPTLDGTFYTVQSSPNKILVSIDALSARLTFLLDSFIVAYFNASELSFIQLTPKS